MHSSSLSLHSVGIVNPFSRSLHSIGYVNPFSRFSRFSRSLHSVWSVLGVCRQSSFLSSLHRRGFTLTLTSSQLGPSQHDHFG